MSKPFGIVFIILCIILLVLVFSQDKEGFLKRKDPNGKQPISLRVPTLLVIALLGGMVFSEVLFLYYFLQ